MVKINNAFRDIEREEEASVHLGGIFLGIRKCWSLRMYDKWRDVVYIFCSFYDSCYIELIQQTIQMKTFRESRAFGEK